MTGEVEVALTEEFETMTAEPAGGQALADTEEVLAVAGLIADELEDGRLRAALRRDQDPARGPGPRARQGAVHPALRAA